MSFDKSLYKKLSGIVAPIAFQYLMSSLVTASDAFMLGFLDQNSLSASSLAGQVAFVFSLFYGAFVFGLRCLRLNTGERATKKQRRKSSLLQCVIR